MIENHAAKQLEVHPDHKVEGLLVHAERWASRDESPGGVGLPISGVIRALISQVMKDADALAAATAERDQAVRELAEQKQVNVSNLKTFFREVDQARQMLADADEKWRFEHTLYEDAILQRDTARERLSNAPHDGLCAVWDISGGEYDAGCTCWKAGL